MGTFVLSEQLLGRTSGRTNIRNRRKSSAGLRSLDNSLEPGYIPSQSAETSSSQPTPTITVIDNNMSKTTSSTENLVGGSESKCCCAYEFHTADADIPTSQVRANTLLGGLVAHTTSHGIPHINVARGVIKKTVWTLITLLMVGALVTNLVLIITNFLAFRVDIVIQMQHQRELAFPAISICNVNPVKSTMLNAVPAVKELVYGSTYNSTIEGLPIPGTIYPERTYPRISFLKEEKLAEILADLNSTTQFAIGHLPQEMILDCQYSGFPCYYQDFIPFYNPLLGNCFVFNSGWKDTTVRKSVKTGRRYGLKLILNIDQDLYLPDYVDSAGVRVVIHPQTRMPFPQDEGVVVAPGLLTSIGLRQLEVKRKGDQYGNCTNIFDSGTFIYHRNATRNVFEQFYDVRYSSTACYKTCYQRYLTERCSCGDAQYPLFGEAFGDKHYKACNSTITTEDDCKYITSTEFNSGELKCQDCVLPCREISYQPEISSVQWPSDVYESTVLQKYGDSITSLTNESEITKYKRNLLKTEIYYEEFNYENIEERPSYGAGQFFSDIGGVLGLWLGWSIMTVFEFIEFFIDMLVLGCIRLLPETKKKRPQSVSSDNSESNNYNNNDRRSQNNGKLASLHVLRSKSHGKNNDLQKELKQGNLSQSKSLPKKILVSESQEKFILDDGNDRDDIFTKSSNENSVSSNEHLQYLEDTVYPGSAFTSDFQQPAEKKTSGKARYHRRRLKELTSQGSKKRSQTDDTHTNGQELGGRKTRESVPVRRQSSHASMSNLYNRQSFNQKRDQTSSAQINQEEFQYIENRESSLRNPLSQSSISWTYPE